MDVTTRNNVGSQYIAQSHIFKKDVTLVKVIFLYNTRLHGDLAKYTSALD